MQKLVTLRSRENKSRDQAKTKSRAENSFGYAKITDKLSRDYKKTNLSR